VKKPSKTAAELEASSKIENIYKYGVDPGPAGAADAADHIRALYPHLRSSQLRRLFYMRSSKHRAMVEEDIARLGLPE
jgi:hypothetical protein